MKGETRNLYQVIIYNRYGDIKSINEHLDYEEALDLYNYDCQQEYRVVLDKLKVDRENNREFIETVAEFKREEQSALAAQEGHKKRKTTTSTAVKARYNKKHYTRVPLDVPKELAEQFKKKCAAEGTSCSAVLKAAIEEFLKKLS